MEIGYADNNSDRRHLNTTFAQLDLETLRYLSPNDSYAATCRDSECDRRYKTPSLERLWQYIPYKKRELAKGGLLADKLIVR
jgi:hypothetical protein